MRTPRNGRRGSTLWGCLALTVGLLLTLSGAVFAAPTLQLNPARAHVDSPIEAIAQGLEPGKRVQLTWHTNRPEWAADLVAGTFNGIEYHDQTLTLAEGVTDDQGSVRLSFAVPEDFGYLHNVTIDYADGTQAARQGILVEPTISVSPTSGPVGTPIEVTVKGVGFRPYDYLRHILYDNRFTGIVTAINTRGTARVTIPAVGEPGVHSIQLMRGAYTAPYLNPRQSPNYIPGLNEPYFTTFRITEGEAVVPSAPSEQTLPRLPFEADEAGSGPTLSLNYATGHVGETLAIDARGFPAGAEVQLTWSRVVGNRVSGQGWQEDWITLGSAVADQDGAFQWEGETPDDLGGAHTIRATVAGSSEPLATAVYTIQPSVAQFTPTEVKPGEMMTIQLKGIGWTETENIITMVHDNAYIGYACGFNTQGDVTIYFYADTRPGWHYIDLYPAIYKGNMGAVSSDPFRLPMLNVPDHPGAELPAFRLAYHVVDEE